jgi:type I protein arginine methyltransferase
MMSKQRRKVEQITDELIKVRAGGQEFVIAAACSHRQGRLVYGYVNDRTQRITCPLHRSTFDLTTGCPLSGPANERLRVDEDAGRVS